ncbi:adenosylhomocysteinase [Vespertiliibacter pulmonis]|uniref:Adenosylhomocysteinase n=1 Tax=Vespertiliibacter pulmonis TaxID=1443036 RepID=A0A3N4VYF5_9PAST|nr:adenosylhomocysteinase [Vespertiliibacter pulmonis]QLB20386.1 adenosylhomocysteinase [Vespertiliibacter pulmonis]RPE86373.1 adenosylhomocysteinase [Vespertiliibacter pulmonis]
MYKNFSAELAWAELNMVRTKWAVEKLPDLSHIRLACNMHLDLKMAPLVKGLLDKGAKVFLTTCNPTTVQNDVVDYLVKCGAEAKAWRNMSQENWHESFREAIVWNPTHLCEMGADLTTLIHSEKLQTNVKAGLEATGSGVSRLNGLTPNYPIFNWDDLPVKEGLHNRHMVGLTAWHTFFDTTHLTLHEKTVVVIGYGLVGQGVAHSAKAYGGKVIIAEIDKARALQAEYDGWQVMPLEQAVGLADIIATATGAKNVLSKALLEQAKSGVFILNVGHVAEEVDVAFLKNYPMSEPMPYINAYQIEGKIIYLLADGSMFNLTAGYGDSLNAFDVTLAVMASGIGYIVGAGEQAENGVYLLPKKVWETVL